MKTKIGFILIGLIMNTVTYAQIAFKTEYLGNSQYWHDLDDEFREKVNNSKGSVIIYQADIKIPLSKKINSDSLQTIWAIAASGSYAQLDNKNFVDDMVSEITNLQLGLIFLRPLNERWSLLSSVGGGIYAPFTDLSKVKYKNVLGNVGVIFIRHLKPNLTLGGGFAINSAFGYPMAFPAIYFAWSLQGNYYVNISIMTGLDIKAGYKFNDFCSLNLVANGNGQMALLEKDGKDMMFTHQYFVVGLSPEFIIQKHFSISLTAGINAFRPTYYNNRTLKGMFTDDTSYYFGTSAYVSVGIVIK